MNDLKKNPKLFVNDTVVGIGSNGKILWISEYGILVYEANSTLSVGDLMGIERLGNNVILALYEVG